MSRQTSGLILLFIATGFFLSWGYIGANANGNLDIIIGTVFALAGFSMIRFHPVADTAESIASTVNKFIEKNANALPTPFMIKESVAQVEEEAQQAMREIRETTRARIRNISHEVDKITNNKSEVRNQ